jgi:predicted nucleic acid-binding protein
MIAIDTNVLVRLLTRDDEPQFQRASTFFAENKIFTPETVILEIEWVLRFAYKLPQAAILEALRKTLGLPNVQTARPGVIAQALDLAGQGLDFADALHLAASQECSQFATFDTSFIKKANGLTGCQVRTP